MTEYDDDMIRHIIKRWFPATSMHAHARAHTYTLTHTQTHTHIHATQVHGI